MLLLNAELWLINAKDHHLNAKSHCFNAEGLYLNTWFWDIGKLGNLETGKLGSRIQNSGFRIRIQDQDSGPWFRITILDSGSGFRIRVQDQDSGFRITIQNSGSGFRIRVSIASMGRFSVLFVKLPHCRAKVKLELRQNHRKCSQDAQTDQWSVSPGCPLAS